MGPGPMGPMAWRLGSVEPGWGLRLEVVILWQSPSTVPILEFVKFSEVKVRPKHFSFRDNTATIGIIGARHPHIKDQGK